MEKMFKKTLELGFGITTLTQQQVNKFVKELMKTQGIDEKETKKLAKNMIKESKKVQQKVNKLVMDATSSLFRSAGLATKKDIEELKRKMKKKKG